MLAGFLLLLLLKALSAGEGRASEQVCAYQDVLNYLNLTKNNELFFMTRPVKDYKQPTRVCLEVQLYAILDVREIDQMFVAYVWIVSNWYNQHIRWNPEDFCGIETISIPTEVLWKPDICIDEMTEKDKAPPSPHLTIYSNGLVNVQNDQVLVSTCRMHVYKFPFDIQRCNLSFKSVVHSVNEIQLVHHLSPSEDGHATMRTQYEWLFISMTVTNKTVVMFNVEQDVLVYTISMKRRCVLYIVNFLLPLLIFLFLDLASFLISDTGGEKLSFKITVMLAVTVMQLILNDILPSSSDRIPLIVAYCIGILGLMMLSLLETILVMYLIGKDSEDKETEGDRTLRDDRLHQEDYKGDESIYTTDGEDKRWTAYACDLPADQAPAGSLKDSSGLSMEERHVSEKISDELREVAKALALLLNSRKEDEKPGYWSRKTKAINRAFFIFYVMSATLFLACMFSIWLEPDE